MAGKSSGGSIKNIKPTDTIPYHGPSTGGGGGGVGSGPGVGSGGGGGGIGGAPAPVKGVGSGGVKSVAPAPAPTDPGYPPTDGGYDNYAPGGGPLDIGSFDSGVSDEDYLAGDAAYQAQMAALMKALSDYNTDATKQRTNYDTDYTKGLQSLGWNDTDKDLSTPDGSWDWNDQNSAAGRGYQSQMNDFASRGLLQSSLYGTAFDNLQRTLNDQKSSIGDARTKFLDGLTTDQGQYQNENTLAQQQARAEAIARRSSGYNLGT